MPDQNIQPLRKETFLKALENSVGTRLFNTMCVRFKDTGKVEDILNDGDYSCAFFVSSLLYLFGAINKPHATVANVMKYMDESDQWRRVGAADIAPGDVLFWEKVRFDDGTENAHLGIAVTPSEAVSVDYMKHAVARHPITRASAPRKIEAVYRYEWPEG